MNPSEKKIVLIGGGGHASSVISALHRIGIDKIEIIDKAENLNKELLGVRFTGTDDDLVKYESGDHEFLVTVGSVRDNKVRKELFQKLVSMELKPFLLIAKSAVVGELADIGSGTVILEGAIVNTKARIGSNCIINSGAIIEHNCIIGDHVHVAPGAVISGGVSIGDEAFIGIGARIIQNICIGSQALVAAGATVVRNVSDKAFVAGVPAKEKANE